MKNTKRIFFIVALIILILTVSTAVSATNDTTNDHIISESSTTHVEPATTPKTVKENTIKNNKINKTTTEKIKTETQTVDLYVSDNTGSDTNTGTQDKPYKTIQTALDKTTNDKTYNIYLAEGTYKGRGNTNLTVDGNNHINFIGSGINKTILDGQAHFDINPSPGYVWASSEIWWPYLNESGDYAMTITNGTGLINMENMTISNMYCRGGWAISLYEHAPIDNYANLNVNQVFFDANHGGCGSAIRNNRGATLTINNSLFMNNSKAGSTGNNGIVYNNGTATILNTVFDHNYVRWASILNDHNLTVINTTLKNGQAYDGMSGYKYGTGIGANSGNADYFAEYFHLTHTNILNCTFLNNEQNDIYVANGNFNLTGNKFINTTGITITDSLSGDDSKTYCIIDNNLFENMQPSSITETLLSHKNTFAIDADGSYTSDIIISNNYFDSENGTLIKIRNSKIINNTIIAKKEIAISSEGNNNISSNIISGVIKLFRNNDTIKNNQINTNQEYTIDVNGRDNIITNNNLISFAYLGDYSVNANPRNIIENNTPIMPEDYIYVSFEANKTSTGTPDNPTTITDALQKVENNGTICLLATKNESLSNIDTININTNTVKSGTNTFTITSLTNTLSFNRTHNEKENIFNISEGYTITLSNLGFENMGLINESMGGAIYSEGNLNILNCNFNNTQALYGGAIFVNKYAEITIRNSTFTNVKSPNECIYLNTLGKKTLQNNKYYNSSINHDLQIESNNTYNYLNNIIHVNITGITLTNPNFYDNNILENITYNIYLNDKLVNTTKDNSFEVPPRGAESKIYVIPEFSNIPSNTLILETNFGQGINITLNTPTKTIFTDLNEQLETIILDQFGEKIHRGQVSYYNRETLIATCNVEDGKATCTIPKYDEGIYDITIKYEDNTGLYQNVTNTAQLIILDKIYCSPTVTTPQAGTRNKPTTIPDALNKIQNNHIIILTNQENKKYIIDQTININKTNIPENVNTFTITGENIIIDAQNKHQIINIEEGYNITLNNITFTNGFSTNGAAINSKANLTLNNTRFINNHATENGGAIRQNKGQLTITNSEFTNNTANTGAAIQTNNTIVTITNSEFTNCTSNNELLYLNNSQNTLNNNTYNINSIQFTCNTTIEQENTPLQQNEQITITTTNITLTNPTYYDEDILEKTTYNLFLNDKLHSTLNTNTAIINLNKIGDNKISLIPSFAQDQTSAKIIDVEYQHLKNTIITVEEAVTEENNKATIKVTVLDKTGQKVTGTGTITITDENNQTIGTNTLNNGQTEIITTTTFRQGGIFNITINYNTTETYNNQTNTTQLIVKFHDVYVRPSVTTQQMGTIDNPTTIPDALQKVAQGGTIHFLKDDINTYYIEETIIINTTTTKNVTSLILQAETPDITLDGQFKINTMLNISSSINLEIKDISFADAKDTAIYNEGNLTINGTAEFSNQKYGIYNSNGGNLTILGNNTFYKNTMMAIYSSNGNTLLINGTNKFIENMIGIYNFKGDLSVLGSNIFQDNIYSARIGNLGAAITSTGNGQTLINGTNIFENNIVDSGSATMGGAISVNRPLIIDGKNIFNNNKAISATSKGQGGAIYSPDSLTILGENIFSNNQADTGGTIWARKVLTIEGNNIFINSSATSNGGLIYHNGEMVILGNNIFSNSSAQLGGAICYQGTNDITINDATFENITSETGGVLYTTTKASSINFINNTLTNINSNNETIYFTILPTTSTIENNTFTNCSIKLQEFIISSPQENMIIPQNTPININITSQLLHPEFYDEDILNKTTYYVHVNDENKYTTTENNITINEKYPTETGGTLTIYSTLGENTQSNNITITIMKPLDTTIEVTTPTENTVNKTTPITIMLLDEEGNLVKDTTINMTLNNETEEITLTNGAIVYQFTPETIGNITVKFSFAGNDTLNPTETEITINVVADKDKIIEDLNKNLTETTEKLENTTQKADDLEEQLADANQTINNQKTTLDNLNKTLTQTQKDLQNAKDKIAEQNNTINNLNKQLTETNKKVDDLTKANNDLTQKLADANKKIDNLNTANNNLNKQLADTNKKVDDLTQKVNDLTKQLADSQKTIDNLNKTIADKDATIKELTTKIATKVTVTKINTTKYASTVTVTGKITDKNGKALNNMPVSIKINSATTKVVTNANGVYKYTTTATTVATNNVTVTSITNDKYTSSSAKTTFKVSKATPTLKIGTISAVKYKDSIIISGSLMDSTYKAISSASLSLKINTKTVTVKTAKDGSFTYKTTATSMGTNNVTITYAGNTKYNKVTKKTTFKVNKQTLILTVDRVASGLKYKDPLVVGGRLVDGNGKAVANTQVSLQFNGKTYKAKTDKNGYYKVTTRATTMGTNNLTASYAGNARYDKATAKTTFTVAKQDLVITFNTVKYSNGKVTISGTFTDRNRHALMNSLARITLNGKQGTAKTDKTGTFTYTTKANKGTYKVTLAYPGNERYNAYSKSTTVNTA